MNRRILLQSLALIGAAASVAGFGPGNDDPNDPVQQSWIPGHVENNDPIWGVLNGAQVAVDDARGLMTAQFTDSIRHLQGHTLSVSGFLMPLDARSQFTHFVLTRRNSSCPFCPPNLPTEAIEVFTTQALEYSPDEYLVSGPLELTQASADGLFFKISQASVRKSPA